MPDPLDPVEAQRVIEQALYEAEVDGLLRSAGRIDIAKRIAAALAALPAPVPEGVPEDRIVPEGWRVEWLAESPIGPVNVPRLVPYRPEDTKGGDDEAALDCMDALVAFTPDPPEDPT